LIAGVFVRLHNIGGESIDLEEYACLGGMRAPDFATFFQQQREIYPYGAPLAPSAIYFWTHHLTGDYSIANIRVLFAIIGILVMMLGYVVARLLFQPKPMGRRAGLVVLLCIALSPVHVFHSQEARMYAFVSFFALLGVAAFIAAMDTGHRRWWWLHWTANIALIASHYFAVFMLPVYGLVLLAAHRRRPLRIVWWCAGHFLIVVALFLWVRAIPPQADELYSYYASPAARTILIHTFAGDSTSLSATSFFPSDDAWYFLPEAWARIMRESSVIFDGIIIIMSVAGLVFGGIFFLRNFFRLQRKTAMRWLLLLCWAVLPVLLISAVTFLWRPIYGSRYVMYSMFAFYLLAGGLIGSIRRRSIYAALMVLVVIAFGYQISFALPPQTRAAWRQAYEHVIANSRDIAVLLLEDPFWLPVLEMNIADNSSAPVAAAFERNTLCNGAAALADATVMFPDKESDIWVLLVLTKDFDETSFTDCLNENRLNHERHYYPGERSLALYKIIPANKTATTCDVDSVLFESLVEKTGKPENAGALDAIRKEVRYLPDNEGGFWLRLGLEMGACRLAPFSAVSFSHAAMTSLGSATRLVKIAARLGGALDVSRLARVALRQRAGESCEKLREFMRKAFYTGDAVLIDALGLAQMEKSPLCYEAFLYRGIAAHRSDRHDDAVQWFDSCPSVEIIDSPEIIEAYGISLTETGRYDSALDILQAGIEKFPDYYWLHMRMGIALAALDRHNEAVEALRVSHAEAPDNAYIIYLLMESLVALQRYEEAARFARHPAIVPSQDPWVWVMCWRAFTGAGMDTEGAVLLARLAEADPAFKPFYRYFYEEPSPEMIRKLLESAPETDATAYPEVQLLLKRMEERE